MSILVRKSIQTDNEKKYLAGLPGRSYDAGNKILSFDVNESAMKGFRLVYNIRQFIDLIDAEDGRSITRTIYSIFEGTKQECEDRIDTLRLLGYDPIDGRNEIGGSALLLVRGA